MPKEFKVGSGSVKEMVERIGRQIEENKKKLEENGGMCIKCGKIPAEVDNPNAINSFHCPGCNALSEELLKGLRKKKGFSEFKVKG